MLLNVPTTFNCVEDTMVALVNTGKFCKLFAPESPSPESLAVTPLVPRSIASPVFE